MSRARIIALSSRVVPVLLAAAVLAAVLVPGGNGPALAGGPFIINGEGEPLAWDTSSPIVFNMDQGALGQLSPAQAQALAQEAFDVWANAGFEQGGIPITTVQFTAGDMLPCDVTPDTVVNGCGPDNLEIVFDGEDGLSPVIFDEDGALMDFLFGVGASNDILGVTFIDSGSFLPPRVVEAEIFLNGRFYDGIKDTDPVSFNPESDSLEAFKAVFVHENGHWLNLDHSQLSYQFWLDGSGLTDELLPTMFPSSGDDDSRLGSLNPDDVAALANLYPVAGAGAVVSRIQGQILVPLPGGGSEPLAGANVILRSVLDPQFDIYSSVSGNYYVPDVPSGFTRQEFGGPVSEDLKGAFSFMVLPGTYTLEVEEIDPFFVDGSGIGPLPAPVMVPGRHEFWNNGESFDPVADPPWQKTEITVTGGQVLSGLEIRLNIPPLPAVMYAVDDEKFDPGDLSGPTAIIELDMAATPPTILRRIPAPEVNSAFQEGLAWAASRGTLFFTDGLSSSRDIYELDPVDGTVLNQFPWPAGAVRIDGLAFLEGPDHPPGGVLYALDSGRNNGQDNPPPDMIFGMDPDTGNSKGWDITAGSNLFGALGGMGDDLFVSGTGGEFFHLRPANLGAGQSPVVNFFRKPSLKQFDPQGISSPGLDTAIAGLGYDGETLYAASIAAPDYRVWRMEPEPVTDDPAPSTRPDVMSTLPDPTPIVPNFGGFSAVAVAMRGDIDGSMRVDGFDLAALARAFATSEGDPAFRRSADLDRDSDVDEDDLTVFAAYFGRGLGAD